MGNPRCTCWSISHQPGCVWYQPRLGSAGSVRFTPNTPARGWECPKCGRVWAPGVPNCGACSFRETSEALSEQLTAQLRLNSRGQTDAERKQLAHDDPEAYRRLYGTHPDNDKGLPL